VGLQFNPPPGWPPVPSGFVPPPGWQADPSWPPPPAGWQFWVPYEASAYPGAGVGQPAGYQIPHKAGTSGFAIASFVLGILGLFLLSGVLSIIFGIVALVKIRNVPQRGKGFAIAGLALSAVWLATVVAVLVVAITGQAHRSAATGQINQSGSINIYALRFRDCFDNPDAASVSTVTAIPCTQPHNAQVFAQFDVAGTNSSYPGGASLRQQATRGCNSRIAGNLDRSKTTNTMSIRFTYPLQGSWELGHRSINCLVVDQTPDLTSSLLVAHPQG
jgi:hypothetical protein